MAKKVVKKMKREVKLILFASLIFFTHVSGVIIMITSYNKREEYLNAPQKIYQSIESFSFTFDGGRIRYGVYFGVMFIADSTHQLLVSDVFVVTLNDYFVSTLTAYLDFNVTFSASGINEIHTAVRSDTSSFITSYEVIYEFSIYSFLVPEYLFPVSLHVDFEYTLSSSEFNRVGTFQATGTFDWFPYMGIVINIVVALVVILAIGVIVFIRLRKRKLRRRENSDILSKNFGKALWYTQR